MAFSKAFPRRSDKSIYPNWEDVFLTPEEERQIEDDARQENIRLMQECIADAKRIIANQSLKDFQTNIVSIAVALFDKRASHTVFWKENMAKEKFDEGEEQK